MQENALIRKLRKISKFVMSQTGTQTITINRLLGVSKSKGNQTVKLGQLIEPKGEKHFYSKNMKKMRLRH